MIDTFYLCNVECRQYGNYVVLTATQEHHTMGEIDHEIACITVNDSDSQTAIEQEARNILDDMGFKGAQTEEVYYG